MQLAARWRNLSPEEKQPYLDRHEADAQRFRKESRAADVAARAAVEAKLAAQTVHEGEVPQSRGARAAVDEERAEREARRMERDRAAAQDTSAEALRRRAVAAEKRKHADERRQQRDAEERAVQKQQTKLAKEEKKKAASRLEYLLKQSDIFARLQGGKGSLMGNEQEKSEDEQKPAAKAHHQHRPESTDSDAGDGEEENDEEAQKHVFLTQQPLCIKFGKLKTYQLEALNWMIHLAEKGLNGILADGMFGALFIDKLD